MATLGQIHLPDELFAAIQRRAAGSGLTIEEQVQRDLALIEDVRASRATQLDDLRRERDLWAAKGVHLTDDFLAEAKAWGRK